MRHGWIVTSDVCLGFFGGYFDFFSVCGASLGCAFWQVIAVKVKKAKTKLVSWAKNYSKKIGALKVQFEGRWGETGFGTVGKHSCKAEQSLRAKSIPNGAERDAFVRFK